MQILRLTNRVDTKEKILNIAEKLFYEYGIANVRLQQIADEANISVGNLAYHFKNKEAIVNAVYDDLLDDLSRVLGTYMQQDNLSDFDTQFSNLFIFFKNKNYFLNNLWEIERTYPPIKAEWENINNKLLIQLKKRIEFNVRKGLIQPEIFKGTHEFLAQSLLLTITYWIPQQMLRGKLVKEDQFKKALWNLLLPHFTSKGLKEFNEIIVPEIS